MTALQHAHLQNMIPKILDVLAARGLLHDRNRAVLRWWLLPERLAIQFLPSALRRPTDLTRPEVTEHLRMALGGRRVVPYVGPEGVFLQVGYKPALIPSYPVRLDPRRFPYPFAIPVGATEGGELYLSLDKHPGILVVGTTGSGKTSFLQAVIQATLFWGHTEVLIRDGKQGADFGRFQPWAWVSQDAAPLLAYVLACIRDRFARMRQADARSRQAFPRILLVVDEVTTLTKEEQKDLGEVLTLGRAAGVRVFVATQFPRTDYLDGRALSNMDTRVALKVTAVHESVIALGTKGAEALPSPGWALVRWGGRMTRVRLFLPLEDADFAVIMAHRWPNGYRWRPKPSMDGAEQTKASTALRVGSTITLSPLDLQVAQAVIRRGGWFHTAEIAAELGVSRYQVAQAAKRLENAGLLTSPLRNERGHVQGRRATPQLYELLKAQDEQQRSSSNHQTPGLVFPSGRESVPTDGRIM